MEELGVRDRVQLKPWQKAVLGGLGSLAAGAVAALPLAATHAITESVVQDDAGPIPTEISLAPAQTEVDFGVGGKLYNRDLTTSHFGVDLGADIKVTGPPDLLSAIASGKSPQISTAIKQYADFYGDPSAVKEGYQDAIRHEVRSNLGRRELEAGLAAAAVFGVIAFGSRKEFTLRQSRIVTYGAVGLTVAGTWGLSALNYHDWQQNEGVSASAQTHPLSSLENTELKNTVADNSVLAALVDNGKPIYDQEVAREKAANKEFLTTAFANVREQVQSGAIRLPGPGETMFLMTSDIHENDDMIQVMTYFVSELNKASGRHVIAFVADSGDKSYGETSAKKAIEAEAKIGDGAPFFTINGNHGTKVTQQQADGAGMKTGHGKALDAPGGPTLLGDDDPQVTKLNALLGLGENESRNGDGETEVEAGEKLLKTAQAEHPTILQVHEGHEMAPIVGLEDSPSASVMQKRYDDWFAAGTDNTGATPDEVPDQPAAIERYAHWHRLNTPKHKLYRVVSNSDGTWTLIEEDGTAGGANASQSLTKLSTPWTPPTKTASMVLVTVNNKSGLPVNRQQINTTPQGSFEPQPAIHIGSADGQPYPTSTAKGQSNTKPGKTNRDARKDSRPKHAEIKADEPKNR